MRQWLRKWHPRRHSIAELGFQFWTLGCFHSRGKSRSSSKQGHPLYEKEVDCLRNGIPARRIERSESKNKQIHPGTAICSRPNSFALSVLRATGLSWVYFSPAITVNLHIGCQTGTTLIASAIIACSTVCWHLEACQNRTDLVNFQTSQGLPTVPCWAYEARGDRKAIFQSKRISKDALRRLLPNDRENSNWEMVDKCRKSSSQNTSEKGCILRPTTFQWPAKCTTFNFSIPPSHCPILRVRFFRSSLSLEQISRSLSSPLTIEFKQIR